MLIEFLPEFLASNLNARGKFMLLASRYRFKNFYNHFKIRSNFLIFKNKILFFESNFISKITLNKESFYLLLDKIPN